MSESVSIREELESLRERVDELEQQVEGRDTTAGNGLDHRDRAVLDAIRENGDPGPLAVVKLYQKRTDIATRKTAKRRAETLRSRDDYAELIQ